MTIVHLTSGVLGGLLSAAIFVITGHSLWTAALFYFLGGSLSTAASAGLLFWLMWLTRPQGAL